MSLPEEVKLLIQEEEKILNEVLESLRKERVYDARRFAIEETRARGLTSELVAAQRDEDKQMLASDEAVSHALRDAKHEDLQELDKLLVNPYFARIVVEEEINGKLRNIEYRLGFASNPTCRIVDWRKAPVAKLYYEYKEGDFYNEIIQGRDRDGKVLLRHKLDIENGLLQGLSCRFGNFVREGDEWIEAKDARNTRRRGQAGRLPDILSLITKEQFRAITEDAHSTVLIQGIAGSGKTSVALHRLSWLLHQDHAPLNRERVLIIVKSPVLARYIQESLPFLQMEGVIVSTYKRWCEGSMERLFGVERIARPETPEPPGVRRLKHSLAMLATIDFYLDAQRKRLYQHLEETTPWNILPSGTLKFFQDQKEKNVASVVLVNLLLQETARAANSAEKEQLRQSLESLRSRLTLFREDLLEILKQPQIILERDETRLLDRQLINEAYSRAEANRDAQVFDTSDDPLLLYLAAKKTGTLPINEKLRGRYDHVVVDEVQDFSPTQLAAAITAAKNLASLTLAGDTAQEIGEHASFPGWEKLREHWNLQSDIAQFVSLQVSHRSTLPIMKLAEHVSGEGRAVQGRAGLPPLYYKCLSENSGVTQAIEWLSKVTEKFPADLVCVICRDFEDARLVKTYLEPTFGSMVRIGDNESFSFEEGIVVTDVPHVKGLEFRHILIWNPSDRRYPDNPRSRKLLYVALTRAEDNLCLVTWKNPSPLLPSVYSKLVRGVEEEPELPETDER